MNIWFSNAVSRVCLVSFFTLLLTDHTSAQQLWGMTNAGGEEGVGTIFSITPGGSFTKHYDFPLIEGGAPKGEFFEASNGKIYGVTELGGSGGEGILFEYEATSNDIVVLHDFVTATGTRPIAGVVQGSNGKLYGTCSAGGANGLGVLFEYDITTETYTDKVHFDGASNGSQPQGMLCAATNGTIYGTCWTGGSFGTGVLFSYPPGGTSVSVLHNFAAPPFTLGARPFAGVVQSGNKLIGTTQLGGSAGGGTLYEYDLISGTHAVLYNMGGVDGQTPLSAIVEVDGKYYGTTSVGGDFGQGVLYEYDPVGLAYQVIANFSSSNGTVPIGRPMDGQDGKLYGMCSNGGTNGEGILYSYDLVGGGGLVVEQQLAANNLGAGWGGLTLLNSGLAVGMTKEGGEGDSGGAFNYSLTTNTITVDVSFGFSLAGRPKGRLIEGTDGNLYGMTNTGGDSDEGVIFRFNPNNDAFTSLFSLGGSAFGGFPEGALFELNGFLFGMCRIGGTSNGGTVFKYNLNNGVFTKLANLSATTGTEPIGSFVQAGNGLLYGVCSTGGASGHGTIIQVNPSTNAVSKVHDFDNTNGAVPIGDLLVASNGLMYGTAQTGGLNNDGVLFSFQTNGTFTKLEDLDFPAGASPEGKLLEFNNRLYGTTSSGGPSLSGVVYYWDLGTSTYTQISDLSSTTGSNTNSSILEIGGNLWFTASIGGGGAGVGNGSILRANSTTGVITKMKDFTNTTDGVRPTNGLLEVIAPTTVTMNIKVFLEGPFDGVSEMHDDLRGLASFPLSEPYTGLGFTQVGDGGGESISSTVLSVSGSNAIVDWIMVELRDKTDNTSVLNTRVGLLQSDGDIVDLDGSSALEMSVGADDYYIAVRHRNHLGVLSANTVALSTTSTASIDFTLPSTPTFGTNAQKNISGVTAMYTGNANPDNVLKYTGSQNDRDKILVKIGGSVPTAIFNGYCIEDVNLDGVAKYTGSGNDRDLILVNIGGSVPTSTLDEQLP